MGTVARSIEVVSWWRWCWRAVEGVICRWLAVDGAEEKDEDRVYGNKAGSCGWPRDGFGVRGKRRYTGEEEREKLDEEPVEEVRLWLLDMVAMLVRWNRSTLDGG